MSNLLQGWIQLQAYTMIVRLISYGLESEPANLMLHTLNSLEQYSYNVSCKNPTSMRAKRALEKRAPRLVEFGKKILILHGAKTSNVVNALGSHSKKRPNNLVIGRTYDHHVYDLVEVGVENFKRKASCKKKTAPSIGSKPFFAFFGQGFENVEELKHLEETLLDLFRGQVIQNINLAALDWVYVCTAVTANKVLFTQCSLKLKKSGTIVPQMELVEVSPSMDMVVRKHRLPDERLKTESMKVAPESTKKKVGSAPLPSSQRD